MGSSSTASTRDRPSLTLSSWLRASPAASPVVRGSRSKKSAIRCASNDILGGSCHNTGPSFGPRASTPEAKKLARATSMSRSCFMWVMYRLPLTAISKVSGVCSAHVV